MGGGKVIHMEMYERLKVDHTDKLTCTKHNVLEHEKTKKFYRIFIYKLIIHIWPEDQIKKKKILQHTDITARASNRI